MQETHLFEYAVIRVVPRVHREEFLNIGVILYCPSLKYLGICCSHPGDRLLALSPELDLEELELHLHSFSAIARGGQTLDLSALARVAAENAGL